jgi:hypothetical protein
MVRVTEGYETEPGARFQQQLFGSARADPQHRTAPDQAQPGGVVANVLGVVHAFGEQHWSARAIAMSRPGRSSRSSRPAKDPLHTTDDLRKRVHLVTRVLPHR